MKVEKTFGPPGTGKTEYLLSQMEQELKRGVRPDRIAYLTFTRQARREAIGRAMGEFNFNYEDLPYFKTLHAIAYHELGVNKSVMISSSKSLKPFAERMGVSFDEQVFLEDGLPTISAIEDGGRLLAFDHYRRNNLYSVEEAYRQWPGEDNWWVVNRFCRAYHLWKKEEFLLDFTDLLTHVNKPLPVDVVFVDEAQDLSRLQWKALDVLAAEAERIYIAGDDDQAIFEWAGAAPQEFIRRPGRVRVLDKSYRLPRKVHELALRLAAQIENRQKKTWRSKAEEGLVSWVRSEEGVSFEGDGDYLVLYRTKHIGSAIEHKVRSEGLPYTRNDSPAPGTKWAKAIILWERLRKGRELSAVEIQEVYAAMSVGRKITHHAKESLRLLNEGAKASLQDLRTKHGLLTEEPWYDALDKIDLEDRYYIRQMLKRYGSAALTSEPKIRLSTIHGSKGAQADNVILLTDMGTRATESYHAYPDSERRVFYVGATRAKKSLTLVGFNNAIFA